MEHGKRWTYVKYKCRCSQCVAANATYMQPYRARQREKIYEREKERYQRRKETIIVRVRDYYAKQKTAILRARQNPLTRAKRSASQRARVARQKGSFVENVDPLTLLERHEGVCGICEEPIMGDFHVDHIEPLSRGGGHSYDNCQPAHPRCNLKKYNR